MAQCNCSTCGGSGKQQIKRYDKKLQKTVKLTINCSTCGGKGKLKRQTR